MSPMPFRATPFATMPDVVLFEPTVYADERGWFMETFKASEFAALGVPDAWIQDSAALNTRRGILRGLHYQKDPKAQGKLVRVTRGECFDVIVDLRLGSPTYGKHVHTILSEENKRTVWVPPGFAHGYVTLSEQCELFYKFSRHEYSGAHYRAIRWNDPALGIAWPVKEPILSEKDAKAPLLAEVDNDFRA